MRDEILPAFADESDDVSELEPALSDDELDAESDRGLCAGERLAFVGKLAGMSKKEATALVRGEGGLVVDGPDGKTTWIVAGEGESPLPGSQLVDALEHVLGPDVRQAIDEGHIRLTGETQLWERLGLVDVQHDIQRLYTPRMLAELLGVPVAIVRRWHKRGLIRPTREVKKLPYFDFAEAAAARRLAELLATGLSPAELEKRIAAWSKYLPQSGRPLEQLALIVRGKQLLVRKDESLLGPGGQLFFDFAPESDATHATDDAALEFPGAASIISLEEIRAARSQTYDALSVETPPEVLLDMAAEMEDQNDLSAAADLYRLVLAVQGPTPEVCFSLADVLYRHGDLTAARERYAMAVELNEDFVEARANLGCVLAELGDRELALAAFAGALRFHPEYAEVHYHLARTLTELHRTDEARESWSAFLKLSPDSPWADEARIALTNAGAAGFAGSRDTDDLDN